MSESSAYTHAKAVNAIFGISGPEWFVAKAQRDLDRYKHADDDGIRSEVLVDLCSSLISAEDWSHKSAEMSAGDWRNHHRDACPAHALVALIALVAKHRDLSDGRFKRMRLESTGELRFWTEDASPEKLIEWLQSQGSHGYVVSNVRTEIDDDEIVGYEIIVSADTLKSGGHAKPVTAIIEEALAYWSGVVGQ